MNYYNENDPKAAAWLRELIRENLIAPGEVDERSIVDVRPHELNGYIQHHFFAGIGGWSFALRLAGWPDNRPVRTGSCPCQPFSIAGQGLAEADERHLWPNFRDLITFGDPTITFGEQVASPDGREWLARVRADLEGLGYAVGAADLCAAGVSAPHPRQRLFWVADPRSQQSGRRICRPSQGAREVVERPSGEFGGCSQAGGLVLANGAGRDARGQGASRHGHGHSTEPAGGDGAERVEHAAGNGREQWGTESGRRSVASGRSEGVERMGDPECSAGERLRQHGGEVLPEQETEGPGCAGPWGNFDILPFRDGKFRRVESGSFPLAHGVSGRVGLLRGYGNAIVPQVAATFIRASLEAITPHPRA